MSDLGLIAAVSIFLEKERVKAKNIAFATYDTGVLKVQLVIVFLKSCRQLVIFGTAVYYRVILRLDF